MLMRLIQIVMQKVIKIKLRTVSSFRRLFKHTLMMSMISLGILFGVIFTDTGGHLWWIIIILTISLLAGFLFLRTALGDKIVVDNLKGSLFLKKGLNNSWKEFIRKKTNINFLDIEVIEYKIYEKLIPIGGGYGYGEVFQKYCSKTGESGYDFHVVNFILKSGENIECLGMPHSRQKNENGQWIDVTEQKTREVVDKLNDILNEWREKNEVQSLQEGNLSDNIEKVQDSENEDTELST